ncbi:MAG: transcription termination/antitermination protein NusG [Anaerolineae bacterium]
MAPRKRKQDTTEEMPAAGVTPSPADEEAEARAVEEAQTGEPSPEQPAEGEAKTPAQDERRWYVVHSYSGYENKVKRNLEQRIESMNMRDKIFQVVVPTVEEVELHDGKRRTVERRVFPGYVLVQMIMDDDSWYVVRNTPGVTGFVGIGNKPTPLSQEEVDRILKRIQAQAPKIRVSFRVGQKVRIIDGPFTDFVGTVDEVDESKGKVKVLVSFFGRETPIELDFLQVEKV